MSTMTWVYVVLGVLFVVTIAGYFSHVAGRLDRAHLKVESTRSALNTNAAHRSSLALEYGRLDVVPADISQALSAAARAARDEEFAESGWHLESVLTAAIAAAIEDLDLLEQARTRAPEVVADLASVCRRVQYARRFHNDAVSQARALRDRFVARTFRLAGHAPLPEYIDFDDSVPPPFEAH